VRATGPAAESAPPPPASYLQGLLDSVPAALLVTDVEGSIRYAAGQLDRLGGRSYADLLGTSVADIVPAAPERELLEQMIASAAGVPDGHMVGPARLTYSGVHGSELNTEVWAVNRTGKAGISGIVLLLLPESAYGRFDHVLASVVARSVPLEQAYGAVALALRQPPVAGEAYFLVPGEDDRGTVRTPDLAGVPGPPLAGPWDDVWGGASIVESDSLAKLPKPLAEAAEAAGYGSVTCYAVRPHADGRAEACLVVWRRPESKLMPVARLAVERAVIVASLVRAHRAAEERLRDPAFTDALTGLGNKKSLSQSLGGHVLAGEQPAILYLDLDGFQRVNEDLGRLAGDAVLRVTARRLASVMRPTDELARLDNDEFAVVCNGHPSSDQMVMIAERVIHQLSRPLSVGHGVTADVGVSVGIALGFPVGTPVDDLLGHAEAALGTAKDKGRSNWAVATPEE
jgi:diguanylate cyclase (GGDEF)-like protein